jgi:DNA-binding NarL/FixJ family response regulator
MSSQAPEARTPRHLLLVDDHAIVREGLRHVLQSAARGWIVDEASSGAEALDRLSGTDVDLAVIDLSMPGMNGLELIRQIKSRFERVAVLVLSMHTEEQYALRAFKAGASGYVAKDSAGEDLVEAVSKVLDGQAYVSPGMAARVLKAQARAGDAAAQKELSEREREVLDRLVQGQRLTEIAADLNLSVKTVSTHKTRILEKLGLQNTAALIRYGLEQGAALDPLAHHAPLPSPPLRPR